MALAAGALMAAMLPGAVAAAPTGAPDAETIGTCFFDGNPLYFFVSTDEGDGVPGARFGQVVKTYARFAATCGEGSFGTLTVNGDPVAGFSYGVDT